MKKLSLLLISLLVLLTSLLPALGGLAQPALPTEAQITDYLNAHPLLTGPGAQVISVIFQGEALVIDLSQAVLPEGIYEEQLFTQLQADLDATFNINQRFMTTFKIEGQPLEDWGFPVPEFKEPYELPPLKELPGDGPLRGVKIALSPGHGLYWNETYAAWFYQRSVWFGIREDTLNAEIMRYVAAGLSNQGATVIQLRELDLNARTGVTGYPAWHEDARQYAIALGLPKEIVDGSNNNYNSDIRARPYMANYYGADLFISLHNNGWNGSLSGTESYYDTDNHPGSPAFATAIHNRIIQSIRAEYDSDWVNRGIKSSDNNYGEINYAQMPATLIELAFMDREYPDNTYLHDEAFKILAANAITHGVCDYWGVTCEEQPITLPIVPETPTLSPAYGSGMCDSGWYRYTNPRGEYAYLALNAQNADPSAHQARWQPDLPVSGEYRLEAYIPPHMAVQWRCPEKTIWQDTHQAIYQVDHANGSSSIRINQADAANSWVDLGIFHFNDDKQATVTLTDVTGETSQTRTVSASAMRFTLVGNAGTPFFNTDWLDKNWLTQQTSVTAETIQNFFILHHSCLAQPITDADHQEIFLPKVIKQAAAAYQVSPKTLLAIMEAESNALSQCPDEKTLANLMGLEHASTARDQITRAASNLAQAMNILATTGQTPNGWKTGKPKTTLDGVSVIPANDALTLLFDFTPYAGVTWGGNSPAVGGVHVLYIAWRDYRLSGKLPAELHQVYLPLSIK